jgi:hypothetical protein
MLEVYSFAAMFAAQILILSILLPARLTRQLRAEVARYTADGLPQLHFVGGKLVFFRWLNTAIALLGLALLVGLFRYMQQPDWDDGPVETLATVFAAVQFLPFCVVAWWGADFNKQIRNAFKNEKRRATLQRRGLFDFVSPFVVFLWLLAYPLFLALVFYVQQDPFPGFAGPVVNGGAITAAYAVTVLCVYRCLYGMKTIPLQTNEDRLRLIEMLVKILIYSCLACVVFLSLNFTLAMQDMQRFEPAALSLYFVLCAVMLFAALSSPPLRDGELSGPDRVSSPETRGVQSG